MKHVLQYKQNCVSSNINKYFLRLSKIIFPLDVGKIKKWWPLRFKNILCKHLRRSPFFTEGES